jgi:hypothetical protein
MDKHKLTLLQMAIIDYIYKGIIFNVFLLFTNCNQTETNYASKLNSDFKNWRQDSLGCNVRKDIQYQLLSRKNEFIGLKKSKIHEILGYPNYDSTRIIGLEIYFVECIPKAQLSEDLFKKYSVLGQCYLYYDADILTNIRLIMP